MGRVGKKYRKAKEVVSAKPTYPLPEAVAAVAKNAFAKFDETVEVAHAPGGRSQARRPDGPRHRGPAARARREVEARAGDRRRARSCKEAEDAGADHVGGDDMVDEDPGRLARLRRRRRDARHDEVGRQARQGARPARPDAQPQDRHGHVRRRQGRARDQGRQGRVPRRQDRDHPRAGRQALVRSREAAREREDADRHRDQGQARRGEGQVRRSRSPCRRRWAPGCGSTSPRSRDTPEGG